MENLTTTELSEKELRDRSAERVATFIARINAYDYFHGLLSNPRNKPPFEDFMDFIIRLNGLIRGIEISKRNIDGENVYLEGFDEALVPRHEDKKGLLLDAYNALDKLNSEDIAYLLPAVVNAVHLFVDGNGRTSRVIHVLLTKFDRPEDAIESVKLALVSDGRYKTEDVNPSILRTEIDKILLIRHGILFKEGEDWEPIFPKGFSLLFAGTEEVKSAKARIFMEKRRVDQAYCFISACDYLSRRNILSENTREILDGIALSPAKMDSNLSDDDWDKILDTYYSLKNEHVRILIDLFTNPDTYKTLDGSRTLKDYFITKIKEQLAKNETLNK